MVQKTQKWKKCQTMLYRGSKRVIHFILCVCSKTFEPSWLVSQRVTLITTLTILVLRHTKAQVPFLDEGLRRALHVVANPFPQVESGFWQLFFLFSATGGQDKKSSDVPGAKYPDLGNYIHMINIFWPKLNTFFKNITFCPNIAHFMEDKKSIKPAFPDKNYF